MKYFSRAAVAFVFAATVSSGAWAQSKDETDVAAADTAFFQASVKNKGTGWGEFADPDAVLSYGKGKDAVTAYWNKIYANPGFSLTWHPTYAKVFGDVGVTSGPWESHVLDKTGHDKKATGVYVTVWRRQKDGSWRFTWDGGTEDK